MNQKCTKYEALFTFANDETLKEHVQNCEDCKKEQDLMDRVSEILSEVKPYYKAKRRNMLKLKAACVVSVLLFSSATLGLINFNTDISDTIKYGSTLSAEDFGFPVDSYGLLMVE